MPLEVSAGPVIDLNADVGEGLGDDAALLDVITSANVACGLHAGDPDTMARTCAIAAARGVVVGAHVGYRDRESFGRRDLEVDAGTLRDETAEQIAALAACARAAGTEVRYVKPHGALYHRCTRDPEVAAAVLAGSPRLPVVGAAGSPLLRAAARAGRVAVAEGFADRGYAAGGGLLPRSQPGALLEEADAVAQALALVRAGGIGTLCVHGDTPGAAALARAVRVALEAQGVLVRSFA